MEEKVANQPAQDKAERVKILELYVRGKPEDVEDETIRGLCMDRKKHTDRVAGISAELKSYMTKLQKMAAKMQADIGDANGAIKYVDSKIVQRHIELTKCNKPT